MSEKDYEQKRDLKIIEADDKRIAKLERAKERYEAKREMKELRRYEKALDKELKCEYL